MKIGYEVETKNPVNVDLQRLIDERMLLQANSGGGKSYAVRKLCEITHGKVQQIIIDPEGEFATLREKFDYILVGKDGDIPINIRASQMLARKLLELGTSAIIDLYELKHNERKRFVKLFLDSLMNAPKPLWHHCIIVLDEAHVFAPESSHGQAESLEAVKDLATRGRKRGFSLVAATQRLSKMSKDVVAELNIKLVGRCSLDVDMKRAAYELGFTSKEDTFQLRNLEKGEFFAYGGALTPQVTKIKIGLCQTTHPQAGQTYQDLNIAPREKIKRVLAQMSDLPEIAEQELKTKEDMQRKIIELKREVAVIKRQQPKPIIDENAIKKAEQKGYKTAEIQYQKKIKNLEARITKIQSIINKIHESCVTAMSLKKIIQSDFPEPTYEKFTFPKIVSRIDLHNEAQRIKLGNEAQASVNLDHDPNLQTMCDPPKTKLRDGAMKMLKVAAMFYPRSVTKQQMGTMAGFSIKGGTFSTYLSELKRADWISQNGDTILITQSGLDNSGNIEPLPTDSDEILSLWVSRFRHGASTMLKEIASAYPKSLTKEELGDRTNFSVNGGTFNTYLSELRRNGLIRINGNDIIASPELFPM